MTYKVMMEVPGRKKRRKETWTPLTKKARLETPRQGQDTRLCRDAANTSIKVVEKVVKSRDQFRPHQQSNLQECKCRCRCKISCKFKQLNYTNCKCKKVKECKCNIQTRCVYLLGCKMPNITERYVGEAIDPFDRFRKHMKNAFSDFARTGTSNNKLEKAICLSGPDAHKKWFIVILEDVPSGENKSDDAWRQRRSARVP